MDLILFVSRSGGAFISSCLKVITTWHGGIFPYPCGVYIYTSILCVRRRIFISLRVRGCHRDARFFSGVFFFDVFDPPHPVDAVLFVLTADPVWPSSDPSPPFLSFFFPSTPPRFPCFWSGRGGHQQMTSKAWLCKFARRWWWGKRGSISTQIPLLRCGRAEKKQPRH